MDASLVLAVDGVRAVAQTASEVVYAAVSDEVERAVFAPASDVETYCYNALGVKPAATPSSTASGGKDAIASPSKRFLHIFGAGSPSSTPDATAGSAAGSAAQPAPTPAELAAEVALRKAVLNAQLSPVTDIVVVQADDALPDGFQRVNYSVTGMYPADFNSTTSQKQLWFAVARFPNAPPITGLAIVMLELGEFVPPTFQPVRHVASGRPANLRYGSLVSEAYLCFTRSVGSPIIDFGVCFPHGASVKPLLRNILSGSTDSHGAESLGQARTGFTGSAVDAEAMAERKTSKLTFDLSALPLLGKAAREDVPTGYVGITQTVLKSSAVLTGGTARGQVVICYAKDLSHVDALARPSSGRGDASHFMDDEESPMPSLTDSSETEFRRSIEALSYASGCSPVIPLPIARARAARRRLSTIGSNRLDSALQDAALHEAHANQEVDGSMQAAAGSAVSGKTLTDRLTGAVGKLFGLSSSGSGVSAAASVKAPSSVTSQTSSRRLGGTDAQPSLMSPARPGLGGFFTRKPSAREVDALPSPAPRGLPDEAHGVVASHGAGSSEGSGAHDVAHAHEQGGTTTASPASQRPRSTSKSSADGGVRKSHPPSRRSSVEASRLNTAEAVARAVAEATAAAAAAAEHSSPRQVPEVSPLVGGATSARTPPALDLEVANAQEDVAGEVGATHDALHATFRSRVDSDAGSSDGARSDVGGGRVRRHLHRASIEDEVDDEDGAVHARRDSVSTDVSGASRRSSLTEHAAALGLASDTEGEEADVEDAIHAQAAAAPDQDSLSPLSDALSPVREETGATAEAERTPPPRPRLQTEGIPDAMHGLDQSANDLRSLEARVSAAAGRQRASGEGLSSPGSRVTPPGGADAAAASALPPLDEGAPVPAAEEERAGTATALPVASPAREAAGMEVAAGDKDEGEGEEVSEEERARNVIMFRHMSWIFSPASTRLSVMAASEFPARDGSVSEVNALRGFLSPSAASVTLVPLLKALYVRQSDIVCAALAALTAVVDAGFFMVSPLMPDVPASTDALAAEHALIMSSAWALLDVVVACVCDATYSILEAVHAPLITFLSSVLHCAGVVSELSTRVGTLPSTRSAPPAGLHPATLFRIISTTMACHTFARQKRVYAERGWQYCERAGQPKDADMFKVRHLAAKRQAAQHLAALKSMVHGIVLALERDALLPRSVSLAAHFAAQNSGAASFSAPLLQAGSILPPSSALSPGAATRAALSSSTPGDYSDLSRAFAAHASGSSSLAAEIHAAAQPFVVARAHPGLPADYVFADFDKFGLPARAPVADVVVLVALLCKMAYEPMSFASDASPLGGTTMSPMSATGGAPGGGGGASVKRLTSVMQRDTALHLLSDVFAVAGCCFAASPLLAATVGRMVAPTLLSHALTPRITNPLLSICASPECIAGLDDGVTAGVTHPSRHSAAEGAGLGVTLPPTSVFRTVLQVVGAMWSSRGVEESAEITARPRADDDRGSYAPLNVREACARELNALLHGLVLHTLASRAAPHLLRQDAMEEVTLWVSAPQHLMELYMNHDMYPAVGCPYPHSRLLRSLMATLVGIMVTPTRTFTTSPAVDAPVMIGDCELVVHPDTLPVNASPEIKSAAWDAWNREEFRKSSAALVSSIVRGLMDSAGTVQMQAGEGDELIWLPASAAQAAGLSGSQAAAPEPSLVSDAHGNVAVPVRTAHGRQRDLEEVFRAALPVFAEKGIRKGLAPLLEHGYVGNTASELAHFVRLNGTSLAPPPEVGDFVGDGGRSETEVEQMTAMRREYFGGINFAGMSFDLALRIMLTKAGFRLPGESQKIDRITDAFSQAYYEDNRPTRAMMEAAGFSEADIQAVLTAVLAPGAPASARANLPPSIAMNDGRLYPTQPDVVGVLAFSCIMLNTDAFNPSIKKERKMTRKQFVGNNRGIDNQHDLPRGFLEYLYEAITTNEIKMTVSSASGESLHVSAPAGTAGALPGAFVADVEGDGPPDAPTYTNHLIGTAFKWLNHLSACNKADDKAGNDGPRSVIPGKKVAHYRRHFSATTVGCALQDLWPHIMLMAQQVLKLQAPTPSAGAGGGDGATIAAPRVPSSHGKRMSLPLFSFSSASSSSFSSGLPTTPTPAGEVLAARLGPTTPSENEVRLAAIDTLKYALSAAVFLGLPDLIMAGADAILQVEAGTLGVSMAKESKASRDGWYYIVHEFARARRDAKAVMDPTTVAEAISVVHVAVSEMREAATSTAEAANVEKVAEKFRGVMAKELAADAHARRLVYEGDLTKVASDGRGKHTLYRFFLFNDMLVYASKAAFGGKYTVHQKIPLATVRSVVELPGGHFRVDNTIKSLVVYAATEAEGRIWRRMINEAIAAHFADGEAATSSLSSVSSSSAVNRRGSVLTAFRRDSEVGLRTAASSIKLSGIAESGTRVASPVHTSATGAPRSPVSGAPVSPIAGLPPVASAAPAPTGPKPVRPPLTPGTLTGAVDARLPATREGAGATAGAAAAIAAGATSHGGAAPPAAVAAASASHREASGEVMDMKRLKSTFLQAVAFCRPLLSSDASAPHGDRAEGSLTSPSATLRLSDPDKMLFYAYFKQGTSGDCPEPKGAEDVSMMMAPGQEEQAQMLSPTPLSLMKTKRDAWLCNRGMRRRDAMRAFVQLLDSRVPGWLAVPATGSGSSTVGSSSLSAATPTSALTSAATL